MKKITISFSLLALVAGLTGCKKDGIDKDTSFVNSASAVANPGKVFNISNDNSGNVTITPTGEGASSYVVKFGHGTGSAAEAKVQPGQSVTHAYPEGDYTVTIVSKNLAGQEVSNTYPLKVTYRAPENIIISTTASAHTLKVKASAKYAASYLVYFGDVANETGTPLAKDGEVAHTYANAGNYTVKVVALSGGAAKSEQTAQITIYNAFAIPFDFDDAFMSPFFGTFGTGQQFAIVANPDPSGLNTSAKVGRFTRGSESWSGTYSPMDDSISFSAGKKIKVLAYNPDPALIGKNLNVELEKSNEVSNGVAVLKTAFTTSGAWEELVFDFGTISALPANAKFKQLVLRFNDSSNGAGAVIYVDNFRITN